MDAPFTWLMLLADSDRCTITCMKRKEDEKRSNHFRIPTHLMSPFFPPSYSHLLDLPVVTGKQKGQKWSSPNPEASTVRPKRPALWSEAPPTGGPICHRCGQRRAQAGRHGATAQITETRSTFRHKRQATHLDYWEYLCQRSAIWNT